MDIGADRQLDPGGELLLADRLRRQPDRNVIVAGLVAPGAGRVGAGEGIDLFAPGGEVVDGLHGPPVGQPVVAV